MSSVEHLKHSTHEEYMKSHIGTRQVGLSATIKFIFLNHRFALSEMKQLFITTLYTFNFISKD